MTLYLPSLKALRTSALSSLGVL
ncbi:MAG: hypothetical protein OSP8Acid_01260 [uncultured Acidilobus sp. OSP8]|nr:MAG: hypothetical protein OSP8Acid_01260 [uncultured Acidilobus sp. OSP8]